MVFKRGTNTFNKDRRWLYPLLGHEMNEPVVGNSSNSAIYRINIMYGRKDLPGTNRGVESSPSKELY
jgi:hypothetical protein